MQERKKKQTKKNMAKIGSGLEDEGKDVKNEKKFTKPFSCKDTFSPIILKAVVSKKKKMRKISEKFFPSKFCIIAVYDFLKEICIDFH